MTLDSLEFECEWLFVEAEWILSLIDCDDTFCNWLCKGLTTCIFCSLFNDMLLLWWLPLTLMTSKPSSFLNSTCFVVPLIAAIGLGMLVMGWIIAFGCSCGGAEQGFMSVLISTLRTIGGGGCFGGKTGCWNFIDGPFCSFEIFSSSTDFAFSFFSSFEPEGLRSGGGNEASFFDPSSFDGFDALAVSFLLLEGAGRFKSLFKLRLESLRADENPLLELVRFDVWDLERSLSLLNNFSLSSIECFVVPFCCGCCCCAACAISLLEIAPLL